MQPALLAPVASVVSTATLAPEFACSANPSSAAIQPLAIAILASMPLGAQATPLATFAL